MKAAAALCLMTLLAACSPQPAAEAAPKAQATMPSHHPVTGLPLVAVTVTTKLGKSHRFQAEVATTPEEQARGLMFRTELGADEAMVFPNDPPQLRSFWMKNTVLPLDIIYIGPDRRILNIDTGVPYSTDSIVSAGPVIGVLEINGGRAEELGIAPGDAVAW